MKKTAQKKLEGTLITPKMAAEWLRVTDEWEEANPDHANRPVAPHHVDKLASEMTRGAWRCTNQGILLGYMGIIIDGRHRMMAIVKSGVTCEMVVHQDESLVSARDLPVDVDGRPRAQWWVRSKERSLWEVAKMIVTLGTQRPDATAVSGRETTNSVDVSVAVDAIALVEPALTTTRRKHISQGSVRAMAYLAMSIHQDRAGEIAEQYRAMSNGDTTVMWPITASLSMQILSAASDNRKMGRDELLARSFRVFTCPPARRKASRMQIKDWSLAHTELRAATRELLRRWGIADQRSVRKSA